MVCLQTADTASCQDRDRLDLEDKKKGKKALGDRVAQQRRKKHDIQAVKMELDMERDRVKLELMQLKYVMYWLKNEPRTQEICRFEHKGSL